ncbi:type II secretion system protein F [Citricoccus sp. SGAir0253]|uniref:type II secretion system F family protein n=1 Tax=Citricoccus sp. SGAir0253 TaxID=2567881 RepID=UPI0010CD2FF8|nr:type II secretion system F family protein [Citricoccus sp. SGAir0253]QCU78477.1 type II secretion system protein F [Citricoccus sp. SGAir0253]
MSALAVALVLGLTLGCGLALVVSGVPWGWQPSLVRRVEPQLRNRTPASSLLAEHPRVTPWGALGRIMQPVLAEGVRHLDRFNLGQQALERKLEAAGSELSVQDYRAQQLMTAAAGAGAGMVGCVALAVNGGLHPLLGVVTVLCLAVVGFFLRDNVLSAQVKRRRTRILSEFPSIAELFAMSVSAGDSAPGALERVATSARGALAEEFGQVLADMRAGSSVHTALKSCARRIQLAPVERFIEGVLVALERGTPLADVLRAQARDVRELSKRELLESAGRKEIGMMTPLVFGILPLTVIFAIYPGISLMNLGF